MNHMLDRVRVAVRRWLGVEADRERADAWASVVTTHHEALEGLENLAPELTELHARVEEHQATLERVDAFLTQCATTLNDHSRVIAFQHEVLKRWASGSEVLRLIEKTHHAKQAGGKILTLPESRIIGGH